MRRCFAPLLLARGEAEASVSVLDSGRGAAQLPGSAVPGCHAALLRQRPGEGVSGVDGTEGRHRDARGPSWHTRSEDDR